MLAIVNRVAVARLARRQQVRIPAAANRPRLEAEHRAHADAAGAGAAARHPHHPVDAAGLVRAAMLRRRLVDELEERIAVPHQLPAAGARVAAIHRRLVGKPRRARCVTRREQAPLRWLRVMAWSCAAARAPDADAPARQRLSREQNDRDKRLLRT